MFWVLAVKSAYKETVLAFLLEMILRNELMQPSFFRISVVYELLYRILSDSPVL
jgi:hypothetical protein